MVGTYKNKNTDHQVEETCAIMSAQAIYETDHISLLRDFTMITSFCELHFRSRFFLLA